MSDISKFSAAIKKNGVAKSSHFICDIAPPRFMIQSTGTFAKETIPFYVQTAAVPEIALLTQGVNDTGLTREVVYDKGYGELTLSFFCDQNMMIKAFFDAWIHTVVHSKYGKFMYPESYYAENLHINILDSAKNTSYIVSLKNAYPKIVDDIVLSSDSKAPISFRVRFVYESWWATQTQTYDPDLPLGANTTNSGRAWDLLNLIRSGANKDGLKSMIVNTGVRKIYDILGKTGLDAKAAQKVNDVLNKTGAESAFERLKGIIL